MIGVLFCFELATVRKFATMGENHYLKLGFLFFIALFFIVLGPAHAQIVSKETNVAFLQQNAVQLQQKIEISRAKAFSLAAEKGWETFAITKRGEVMSLQGVDDLGLPIYCITYNNSIAAATTGTNKLYNGGGLGLNLSGSTIPNGKIAIWDGGAILATHTEFATNRIVKKDNASTVDKHSTHVAGTMTATGVYPAAKGMAYGLPQLWSFDFNGHVAEMSANAATLLISNHSYGSIAGWRYNEDLATPRWEFWGNTGANEDYKFGYYDSDASSWDLICYNAPYYLPVKSAGNNRTENGPAVGEPYYRFNASGTMVSAGNRPAGIYSNDGYDIIANYGNAKNILTVGAIEPLPFGPTSASSIQVASFSSWGPTDDGRIKPDLVADGINLTSTSSESNTAYAVLSGTSMATPNVSGSLVLLQELYSQRNSNNFMRSATLKAVVLGTATEAGIADGPDYTFGWGLLNMEGAAKAILAKGVTSIISENSLTQGNSQTINVVASGSGPLVATICWTDPEITAIAASLALDNTALRLVNDLDIRISDGSTTFQPWVLNPANPSAAATKGDNFRDNIEQVYIANAVPGKSYTITISHKGTLTRGPQAYSLVATGVGGSNYCVSAPSSNADSKITNFTLSNLNNSPISTCTTYSDFTSQTIDLEKGKTYPLSLSLGTCGTNFDKIAKVFIDWNGDGDFTDANELVATSNVINGPGIFTASVTVPNDIVVNNLSLLRVVLTETSNASSILPCGIYAKGETQDYRVKYSLPAVDVGVKAILTPETSICANTNQTITVTLKNFGSANQTAIPIVATVMDGATTVATLTSTYSGTIAYLNEADVTLSGSFNAQAGKTYTIVAKTNLSGDLNSSNDQLSTTAQITTPPTVTTANANFCSAIAAYGLAASGGGTIFWYQNQNDVNPIAFGSSTTTITPPGANTSFYAGVNDFKADLGPKNKSDVGDGGYNQFTPSVSVQTLAPMILESAKLYIGNSGQIRFTVVNSSGVSISSVLLTVTATKTNPGAGATSNDLSDQGQVYPLNLVFPNAGSYTINIEYLNGATIFRNNLVTTNYPYATALSLFAITGNTATLDNTPNYFRTFYYYFYDLKIRSAGCMGGTRLAVAVSTPTVSINQNGTLLTSSATTNNQWFLNGVAISGATNQQYTVTQNGSYTVQMTTSSGCTVTSTAVNITSFSTTVTNTTFTVKVYPVPTDGDLNITFDVPQPSTVTLFLSNLLGQVIYREEKINFSGAYSNVIKLNGQANGIYVLRIKAGAEVYTRKITLVR
jgi:hypothetical protein